MADSTETALSAASTEDLISRLLAARETALGDSETVEHDRCVGRAEHDESQRERDELTAVTDEVIRRLREHA